MLIHLGPIRKTTQRMLGAQEMHRTKPLPNSLQIHRQPPDNRPIRVSNSRPTRSITVPISSREQPDKCRTNKPIVTKAGPGRRLTNSRRAILKAPINTHISRRSKQLRRLPR